MGTLRNPGLMTTTTPCLVLASRSPARRRLLRDAGFAPVIDASGVDESLDIAAGTASAVCALAERKASAVAGRHPGDLVLGCDSLLDLDGTALGKPASPQAAVALWRRMSGQQGTLHTGHCLIDTRSGHGTSPMRSGRSSPGCLRNPAAGSPSGMRSSWNTPHPPLSDRWSVLAACREGSSHREDSTSAIFAAAAEGSSASCSSSPHDQR